MNKKLSNDENIRNLKKRYILRIVIIIILLATLVLSVCSIFYNFLIIPTIILFIIAKVITKVRENTPINKISDNDVEYVRKSIKSVNNRRKK